MLNGVTKFSRYTLYTIQPRCSHDLLRPQSYIACSPLKQLFENSTVALSLILLLKSSPTSVCPSLSSQLSLSLSLPPSLALMAVAYAFTKEDMRVDQNLGYPRSYAKLCNDTSISPYSHGPPLCFIPYTLPPQEVLNVIIHP